jgi:hypothetical protein
LQLLLTFFVFLLGDSNADKMSSISHSREIDIESDKYLPFRETSLFNSLPSYIKKSIIEWIDNLSLIGYASRSEIEDVLKEQTKEDLKDMTYRMLQVLISSYRDSKSNISSNTNNNEKEPMTLTLNSIQNNKQSKDEHENQHIVSSSPSLPFSLTSVLRNNVRKITLNIYQPERPGRIKKIDIMTDLTYDEVLRLCCLSLDIPMNWRSFSIVKRLPLSLNQNEINASLLKRCYWYQKIFSEKTFQLFSNNLLWGIIDNNDYIEIRRTIGAHLGGRFFLSTLAEIDKQNISIQSKVNYLNRFYEGYREIRGDGNCYYRSVFIGIIENIIMTSSIVKRNHLFMILFEKFHSVVYPGKPDRNHLHLLSVLRQAAGKITMLHSISLLFSFFSSFSRGETMVNNTRV